MRLPGWVIRWARPLEQWLARELARVEREDWLREARRRYPRGARVECRCGSLSCAGTWWINGWDFEGRRIEVVAQPWRVWTNPNEDTFAYARGWVPSYDAIAVDRFERADPVARVVSTC